MEALESLLTDQCKMYTVYLVDFPKNLFLRLGTVDNSQTVIIIIINPRSAQVIRKKNITNCLF